MEKAKLLLLTTDLKNYEISDLIGIDNVNYFNLKFKKTFGVTPKEFKNNIINKWSEDYEKIIKKINDD